MAVQVDDLSLEGLVAHLVLVQDPLQRPLKLLVFDPGAVLRLLDLAQQFLECLP